MTTKTSIKLTAIVFLFLCSITPLLTSLSLVSADADSDGDGLPNSKDNAPYDIDADNDLLPDGYEYTQRKKGYLSDLYYEGQSYITSPKFAGYSPDVRVEIKFHLSAQTVGLTRYSEGENSGDHGGEKYHLPRHVYHVLLEYYNYHKLEQYQYDEDPKIMSHCLIIWMKRDLVSSPIEYLQYDDRNFNHYNIVLNNIQEARGNDIDQSYFVRKLMLKQDYTDMDVLDEAETNGYDVISIAMTGPMFDHVEAILRRVVLFQGCIVVAGSGNKGNYMSSYVSSGKHYSTDIVGNPYTIAVGAYEYRNGDYHRTLLSNFGSGLDFVCYGTKTSWATGKAVGYILRLLAKRSLNEDSSKWTSFDAVSVRRLLRKNARKFNQGTYPYDDVPTNTNGHNVVPNPPYQNQHWFSEEKDASKHAGYRWNYKLGYGGIYQSIASRIASGTLGL